MNKKSSEELRQQLIELHYGLLDPDEERALRDRIRQEDSVATQWLAAQAFVQKVKDATTVDLENAEKTDFLALLNQSADPGVHRSSHSGSLVEQSRAPSSKLNKRSVIWATSWAMVAAMIGCLIVGRGYLLRLPPSPASKIRLEVTPLSGSFKQENRGYQVVTSLVDDSVLDDSVLNRQSLLVPANVSFCLLSRNQILFSGSSHSDENGLVKFFLPDHVVIPPNSTLKVTAKSTATDVETSSVSFEIPRTRTVTHLTTDRPIYRPGERVFFRSLTLNRKSLQPVSGFPIEFTLTKKVAMNQGGVNQPSGQQRTSVQDVLKQVAGVTFNGVGQGAFVLPMDVEPGDYQLMVHSLDGMFPDEVLPLQIRSYQTPKLAWNLQWGSSSYQAGGLFEADLQVESLLPELFSVPSFVTIHWLLDQESRSMQRLPLDRHGKGKIRLTVPSLGGAQTLQLRVAAVVEEDLEYRLFNVPLQQGSPKISCYPEGGDLVIGLPNRVYFSVRDADFSPVDGKAWLLDPQGERIKEVMTTDDGLGTFTFVPQTSDPYQITMQAVGDPAKGTFMLPKARAGRLVLEVPRGVLSAGESLGLRLQSTRSQALTVQVACRGSLVLEQELQIVEGENQYSIQLDDAVDGVLRVTVLERKNQALIPLAERLVYRRSSKKLNIQLVEQQGLKDSYSKAQHVRLDLRVTDESGNPQQALLGLSVVDQASLSLSGRSSASFQTKFLLLSEVAHPADLENADIYLALNASAERRLDLLLGTQGWRRFASWKETFASEEFPALLTKLLDLDGSETAFSPGADNQAILVSEWFRYQETCEIARVKVWSDLRYAAASVIAIWCLVFFTYRYRHQSSSWLAASLLFAYVGLLGLGGCGAEHSSLDGETEVASDQAMVDQSFSEGDAAFPAIKGAVEVDSMSPDPSQRLKSTAIEPMGMQDVAMNSRVSFEDDEPWKDWLSSQKVEWLLGQLDKVDDESVNQAEQTGGSYLSDQKLLDLLAVRGMTARAAAELIINELKFPLRQYSHQRNHAVALVEGDFQETLLWQPMAETDDQGIVTLEFDLPDTLTKFRIKAEGHTFEGRLGTWVETFSVIEQNTNESIDSELSQPQ